MPRFLALDYWEEREEIIREKTSRLWLFVPEIKHLSEQYLQSTIEHNPFHTPWTQVVDLEEEEMDIYDVSPDIFLNKCMTGDELYSEITLESIDDSARLRCSLQHVKHDTEFEANFLENHRMYNMTNSSTVDRMSSNLQLEHMFSLENPLRKLYSSLPLRPELQIRLKPKIVLDPFSEEHDAFEHSWIQEKHYNVLNDLSDDSTTATFALLDDCYEYPYRTKHSKLCIDKLQLEDSYVEDRYYKKVFESETCDTLADILKDVKNLEAMTCHLDSESCLVKLQDTVSSFVEPYEKYLGKGGIEHESQRSQESMIEFFSKRICTNDHNVLYCKNDAYRLRMKLEAPLMKEIDYPAFEIDVPQLFPMSIDDKDWTCKIYTDQACGRLLTLQSTSAEACTLNMDTIKKDKHRQDLSASCVTQSINFAQMANELKELDAESEDLVLSWDVTFPFDNYETNGDAKKVPSYSCIEGVKQFGSIIMPSSCDFENQKYSVTTNISKAVATARQCVKFSEVQKQLQTSTKNTVVKQTEDSQNDAKASTKARNHSSAPSNFDNNNTRAIPITLVPSSIPVSAVQSTSSDIQVDKPGLTVTLAEDKINNESRPNRSVLSNITALKPSAHTTAFANRRSNFDPCDQFLSILTSRVDEQYQVVGASLASSTVAIVIPQKPNSSVGATVELSHQNLSPTSHTNKSKDENYISNACGLVEVKLSESFIKILQELAEVAKPMLENLKQLQLMAYNTSMKTLKPDLTGYILRQCQVEQSHGGINSDALTASLAVHSLVICIDLIKNVSLQHAVQQLNYLAERYDSTCVTLQTVHKQLCEISCEHRDKNILHPKVVKLQRIIFEHFCSCTEDASPKILVLLKEYCMPFCLELVSYMSSIDGLCIGIVPEKANNTDAISRMLMEHNCLIAVPGKISYSSSFLQQLSLFIEYEHADVSGWKSMCYNAGVNFISMKTCSVDVDSFDSCISHQKLELSGTDTMKLQSVSELVKKRIVLIASRSVTHNNQLLCELEVQENILLIDRDYVDICSYSKSLIHFEDIALDVRSCIVLCNLLQLQAAEELQHLSVKISALALKFNTCWILSLPSKELQDSADVTSNVSKLIGTTTILSDKLENFTVKVIHCQSLSQVARKIRLLSESSIAVDTSMWFEQNLISREPTMQEVFLLSTFSCLNSFTAQLMLSKFGGSLRRLTNISGNELAENCPEISSVICEMFSQLCGSNKLLFGMQCRNAMMKVRNSESSNVKGMDKVKSVNEKLNITENLLAQQVQSSNFIHTYAGNSTNYALSQETTSMPHSSAPLQTRITEVLDFDVDESEMSEISEKSSNTRYSQRRQPCNEKPKFAVELELSYDECESDGEDIVDSDGYICSPYLQSQRIQNEYERAILENQAINRSVGFPSSHYHSEKLYDVGSRNTVERIGNDYNCDNILERSGSNVESQSGREFLSDAFHNRFKGESVDQLYFARDRNDSMNSSSSQATVREVALIAPYNLNPEKEENADRSQNCEYLFSCRNVYDSFVTREPFDETCNVSNIADNRKRCRNTSADGTASRQCLEIFQNQENLMYQRTSSGTVSSMNFNSSDCVRGRPVNRVKSDKFTFNDAENIRANNPQIRRENKRERSGQMLETAPRLSEYNRQFRGIFRIAPEDLSYTPTIGTAIKRQTTHSDPRLEKLKKRKLTYVKDGYLKGGQTRLSFL